MKFIKFCSGSQAYSLGNFYCSGFIVELIFPFSGRFFSVKLTRVLRSFVICVLTYGIYQKCDKSKSVHVLNLTFQKSHPVKMANHLYTALENERDEEKNV